MLYKVTIWTFQQDAALLPFALDEPSINNSHLKRVFAPLFTSLDIVENSVMKWAMTWDFIVVQGLYLISNAPNSVAHKAIYPVVSDLCKIAQTE